MAALLLLPAMVCAQRAISFNVSTSRTFSPDEKPTIHLYTHNVNELEFRLYRVEDPVKFISGLRDLHGFDNGTPRGPKERVDEETWLERFHDWKHHLWFLVRRFFRGQFSDDARDSLRRKQANIAHRSRIVGVAEFAQIPLLNDKQLVARWWQEVPPTFISDSQDLPIDPLPAGIYLVEATDGHYKAYTVLMVSRMVLVTRTSAGTVLAYCVDRQSGAPIARAEVTMGFGTQQVAQAPTDVEGVAELRAAASKAERDNFWIIAKTTNDVATVTPGGYSFNQSDRNQWQSFVYTDRPVYRPGHTVHWKAILRSQADNHLELPKLADVHVTIHDQEDHTVLDRKMPLTKDGTVAGDLTLGAKAPLGYYSIRLGDDQEIGSGNFRVEEYRKPEYQVRVSAAQPRVLEGSSMQVVIDARYFFGEPVAKAKVKYRIYHARHYWWDESGDDSGDGGGGGDADSDDSGNQDDSMYGADQQSEQEGTLDANGKLTITVQTQFNEKDKRHYDEDYTVEAGVTDAANREITGRGRFLATVGSFRVHVEPESYAVKMGTAARFRVSAMDYDNKPVETKVHLQMFYRRWADGKTETTAGSTADVATDAQGNGTVALQAVKSGGADVEASSTTPENRVVQDSTWLWVLGSGESDWADNSRRVQILADKKSYAPGDTAHLSIVSQTPGFHALVVATGYSTEFRKVLSSDGETLTFDLPITVDSQPNLNVSAVFVRDGQLFEASKDIKVPPVQERLQIVIAPASQVFEPQQTANYDVYSRDYQNRPVVADMSFGVVDEAIYSLYPDFSGDIVNGLYPRRYGDVSVDSSLEYYFMGRAGLKSPLLASRAYHPNLAQVKPGNDVVQPKVRKAFPDTAFWVPDVHTDEQGHARVGFKFPDSLTTWRTTVRAVTVDSKAGAAINRVIVRKNIIVRMGTPRFMRKGDEIDLPVIVHNYLDHEKLIQLSLDVHGLDVVSGEPRQITVAAKADGTLIWKLKASQLGTATLLAKALSTEESDALELTFPVEPVGVQQRQQQQGVVKDASGDAQATLNYPANTDPAAHTLHIEVTPSIAGSIFPALRYLSSYPYGCTEQTMSSFLPNVILAETLKKLNIASPVDADDLSAKVQAGFDRLTDYQHDDGGWGWWKEDDSRVFMTAYVVSGLGEAQRTYPLSTAQQRMLSRGKAYLVKTLEEHPRMVPDLRAYVVYALAEGGENNLKDSVNTLWSRRKDLTAEGLAMTGLTMLTLSDGRSAEIAKLLEAQAKHDGAAAYWPSSYSPLLDFSYDNDTESTAFALRFLARADATSPVVPEAAQWLVVNRQGGYWWDSTEQTAFALFGLADYLAVSKELQADFDADIRVNGQSVAHKHFTSADAISGAVLAVDVPAGTLRPDTNAVEVVKHGAGRAYWLAQSSYNSTDKRLYQKGKLSLNLTRDYFRLVPEHKDDKIVYRLEPIKGPVAIGDVLAVHLAVNGSPVKYLMVEDPIAAGTEFVEDRDSYEIESRPSGWWDWYTRREFRDDRAVMFATEFQGRQESFYLVKVVNPGSFSISPARVELMYQPEVDATSDPLSLQVTEP
jgi:uncharacterized protein YfaS (alpha-2-macroglobulin family)